MIPPGPVSKALEADLRDAVRRHGIVFWLDAEGHYTDFVDHLMALRAQGELPYAVHGFRGSYLELMLALEEVGGGVDPPHLVLHLPGFNDETAKQTPLLELVAAGTRYRKKLGTLLAEAAGGRVAPDAIAAFRARNDLSLASADAWLAGQLEGRTGDALAPHLDALGLPGLIDGLLDGGHIASLLTDPEATDAVWQALERAAGLPGAWREEVTSRAAGQRAEEVAFAAASWALCVEYVHDLRRPPVDPRLVEIKALPKPVIDACCKLAVHLRHRHGAFYQRTADETETLLEAETDAAKAEDLGRIDTFRFEEAKVFEAALVALDDERYEQVLKWARPRVDEPSFWVTHDAGRRAAWLLLHDAAALGQAVVNAGPLEARTHEEAVSHYVRAGARADQAHRHLEQRRSELLYTLTDAYEPIRRRLDALRARWKDWAFEWGWQFNFLCRDEGFLPPPSLQQRTLFDDVVRPLTEGPGVTALFLVDALRFEMAEELAQSMKNEAATHTALHARLAELPTVTEVGMNALAPVAQGGRLRPAVRDGRFEGFAAGEFRVHNPATRNRAMWDRVGGDTCPWWSLSDVLGRDSGRLKLAVARAKLVIVHSLEIDAAGEKGLGPAIFDQVLQKLRAAWRQLREAGVRRFVITSDHGFLLLDDHAHKVSAGALPHGRKIDGARRHVLTEVAADEDGKIRVALTDLDYEGVDGLHLIFPRETQVFDTGDKSRTFVHGGNSLQERVIPVLTVVHRAAAGGDTLRYAVRAWPRGEEGGMLRLEARVELVDQGGLPFGGTRQVELALRVVDDPEVRVELCEVRGEGRRAGGAIQAEVGGDLEILFRLMGPGDGRVRVELFHPGPGEVQPASPAERFPVSATVGKAEPPETASAAESPPRAPDRAWLDELPEGGVRELFEHLAVHGAVTEQEAAAMLGGARKLRRFSRQFEDFAASAPFNVRIDVIGGVKRYVRERG